MMTAMDAERVEADGWREIVAPAWTRVSIGDGWIVTVTPAALRCNCGRGLDCRDVIRERMNDDHDDR